MVHLPLVLPPVVIGYALLVLFGGRRYRRCCNDWLGITLAFRWTGAALAAVMDFPLMVRAMRLSIGRCRRDWNGRRTLGGIALAAFYSVTLPLAMPGIAGRAACVCAVAGRIPAPPSPSSPTSPAKHRPLPLAKSATDAQNHGGDAAILRLAPCPVVLSIAALAASVRSTVARGWLDRRVGVIELDIENALLLAACKLARDRTPPG